jgi:hypothetical protein
MTFIACDSHLSVTVILKRRGQEACEEMLGELARVKEMSFSHISNWRRSSKLRETP